MIGFFELIIIFMVFGVGFLGTIFWIWMLADCLTKEPSQNNDKVLWVLVIAVTHFVGALLYFFLRRPQRIREVGA